jgi:hypothetical protein
MDIMRTHQPGIAQRRQIVYIESIDNNLFRYYGRDINPPHDIDEIDTSESSDENDNII